MKKYIKNYLNHFDYPAHQDTFIPCEVCGNRCVDFHHIKFRSQGGGDEVENIAALCREHHNQCHASKEFNNQVLETHLKLIYDSSKQTDFRQTIKG